MSWRYRPAVDAPISEVELLQALIRFDTSSPPGNEKACVEFAGGLLEQAGVDHRVPRAGAGATQPRGASRRAEETLHRCFCTATLTSFQPTRASGDIRRSAAI